MLSLVNQFQLAGSAPPEKFTGETILNADEKVASSPISTCKHSIFANCFLLIRDANQAKQGDVLVPLNEDVILTILKLCLSSSCAGKCAVTEQTSIGKDSGFSDLLTTSTSTLSNAEEQAVAEKEDDACCSSEVSSPNNVVSNILDWSIASGECAQAIEHAKLHRSGILTKPVDTTTEEQWTDDEAAERSTLLCASSTPRRRKEMDAGFDRFMRSLSCGPRGNDSEAGSVDGGLSSQASRATTRTEDVMTEATLSENEQDLATTIDSLDELADEPQTVLCSDFSWLYKHKRIRDTLLSIGATQSVMYEIMMRNRYYDECDEREQRMIVDTCKVRRAVEEACSERLERVGAQLQPTCRYVFSDSEDDEEEQNASPSTRKRGRPRSSVGRPRKFVRKQSQAAKKRTRWDAVQIDGDHDQNLIMYYPAAGEPSMQSASASADLKVHAVCETPNATNNYLQLPLTRSAKIVAKRAIFVMFNLHRRQRTKRAPSRNLKAPFSNGLRTRCNSQQDLLVPDELKAPITTTPSDSLEQSFVIRSRKRKHGLRRTL